MVSAHPSMQQAMSEQRSIRNVRIVNPEGLHVRAAGLFVRTANRFQARIAVVRLQERVDGKGILGLLTLGAHQGTDLLLEAEGPDAEQAVQTLADLIDNGFQERAAPVVEAPRAGDAPTAADNSRPN